jgi:hypothetical protein
MRFFRSAYALTFVAFSIPNCVHSFICWAGFGPNLTHTNTATRYAQYSQLPNSPYRRQFSRCRIFGRCSLVFGTHGWPGV